MTRIEGRGKKQPDFQREAKCVCVWQGVVGNQRLKVEWTGSSDTFGKGFYPFPLLPCLLLNYLLVHCPFRGLVFLHVPSKPTTHFSAIYQKLGSRHWPWGGAMCKRFLLVYVVLFRDCPIIPPYTSTQVLTTTEGQKQMKKITTQRKNETLFTK